MACRLYALLCLYISSASVFWSFFPAATTGFLCASPYWPSTCEGLQQWRFCSCCICDTALLKQPLNCATGACCDVHNNHLIWAAVWLGSCLGHLRLCRCCMVLLSALQELCSAIGWHCITVCGLIPSEKQLGCHKTQDPHHQAARLFEAGTGSLLMLL